MLELAGKVAISDHEPEPVSDRSSKKAFSFEAWSNHTKYIFEAEIPSAERLVGALGLLRSAKVTTESMFEYVELLVLKSLANTLKKYLVDVDKSSFRM